MPAIPKIKSTLYEQDYDAWLQQQAALARAGKAIQLDLDKIAEELEDMSRRERRALESQLTRLLMHLLKWQYQPQRRSGSWHLTIRNARRQIDRLLEDSPSLQTHLQDVFERCYADARGDAAAETEQPTDLFPEHCPFTQEQTRDSEFPFR